MRTTTECCIDCDECHATVRPNSIEFVIVAFIVVTMVLPPPVGVRSARGLRRFVVAFAAQAWQPDPAPRLSGSHDIENASRIIETQGSDCSQRAEP